jgi:5-methylcytosine-specific restriction endonuclease McrA
MRGTKHKKKQRGEVWAECAEGQDRPRCAYCGAAVSRKVPVNQHPDLMPRRFTQDHIVPRADGGTNVRENMIGACEPCNLAKGDMPLDAFVAQLGEVHMTIDYARELMAVALRAIRAQEFRHAR